MKTKKNKEVCNTYPEHKGCKFIAAFYATGASVLIVMLFIL